MNDSHQHREIAALGAVEMEATDLREDTGCIVLCHCLYTGVAWDFGNTQFNSCNTHTETDRPTLTDNEDSE